MGKYDDIIGLPHHVSKKRPQMPIEDRAAQFAPFAALRGFTENIAESERFVEHRVSLSEDQKESIDLTLSMITDDNNAVSVKYFVKDTTKPGGRYVKEDGRITNIDKQQAAIVLTYPSGGSRIIPFEDLYEIFFTH
ncbi:MAG: YolD-like family protein [Lachnospiraceae bacterium]|nr:YolD-like family protein [Lachnospiraceae bacterium]